MILDFLKNCNRLKQTINGENVRHIKTYNLRYRSNVRDDLDIETIENRKTTNCLLTTRLFINIILVNSEIFIFRFVHFGSSCYHTQTMKDFLEEVNEAGT